MKRRDVEWRLFLAADDEDNRAYNKKLANLYYINREFGLFSRYYVTTRVSGRPFMLFKNAASADIPEQYWITIGAQSGSIGPYESVAQLLGGSHEIQYCAAAAGIPYDVVGVVEFLILAIV